MVFIDTCSESKLENIVHKPKRNNSRNTIATRKTAVGTIIIPPQKPPKTSLRISTETSARLYLRLDSLISQSTLDGNQTVATER
ncbi:MAG: hypothetical protein ACP5ER_00580 [Candidatus Bathyarchaeales archaeon]